MFFILSKVLGFVISPLTWVFTLLIVSLCLENPRRSRRLRIIAVVILYLCSNGFLVDECFRAWEPVTADIDTMNTGYNAAIVLGGIGDVDLRQQKINFGPGVDRLLQPLPLL